MKANNVIFLKSKEEEPETGVVVLSILAAFIFGLLIVCGIYTVIYIILALMGK
jgi:hypothetical protein